MTGSTSGASADPGGGAGLGEGGGGAAGAGGVEPVAAVLANPRLRVKTADPKWNTIPVEARALRKRVKTYDASWHQGNFVHPLNAQIFI